MRFTKPVRGALMAFVAVSMLLAQVALAETAPDMTPDDFQAALARAKAEDKPLVIDFYTDW